VAQATAAAGLTRRMSRSLSDLLQPRNLVLAAVVAAIAYLAVVPLGYLLWGTFFDEQGFTLRFFEEAYARVGLAEVAVNSAVFALGSTALSVGLGTMLAYLQVRTDVPLKRLIFAASLVPLIIPGILHTVAWILLLSPRTGLFNAWLKPVFGPETFDIFTMPGMILVEGLHLSPLVFLLMAAAFRSMDPALEESALISGAGIRTVVRRITLPLVRPALLAAVLVMMVRVLEAFEVAAILGPQCRCWVFISRVFSALRTVPPKYGQAGALAISVLLVTTIGVYLYSRLSRRGGAFETVTGKGFRPRPLRLGRWRWPATALVFVYFLIAVVMPILILLYSSTQPFYSVPSAESFSRMSLDNYVATFTQPQALTAFRNSLILGVGTATFVVLFMAMASWLVVRTRLRAPGDPRAGDGCVAPLRVPAVPAPGLRDAVDPVRRLRDPVHAVWDALRLHIHVPDRPRAGRVGPGKRCDLVPDLPSDHPAPARTGAHIGMDLHRAGLLP
jgi:iron(III) transport system permease protein